MNLRTAVHLGLITSLGSLMVLWVSQLTEQARSDNRRDALRSSLIELLRTDAPTTLDFDASRLEAPIALCSAQGTLQAALIPGSGSGYAGEIEFVVAVDRDGQVSGVRVTSHSETPGIGDVIEASKSTWIHSLSGRDAEVTTWELVKDGGDIDGVSGASITLRGLVRGVGDSLPHRLPECGQ